MEIITQTFIQHIFNYLFTEWRTETMIVILTSFCWWIFTNKIIKEKKELEINALKTIELLKEQNKKLDRLCEKIKDDETKAFVKSLIKELKESLLLELNK